MRVLRQRASHSSVITSYPYRYNAQLHTYLGMLTLYRSLHSAPVRSTSTSRGAALREAPTAARRAAYHHFENAVKVAARAKTLQNNIFAKRMRLYRARMAHLQEQSILHREQLWRTLRDDAWVFRSEPWDEAASVSTPSTPRKRKRKWSSSNTPVETDTDAERSDLHDIETELETGFGSDESISSQRDAAAEAFEGPAQLLEAFADHFEAPPDAAGLPDAAAPHEVQSDAPAAPATADPDETLFLPATEWAVECAQMYMKLVRELFSTMLTAAAIATGHFRVTSAEASAHRPLLSRDIRAARAASRRERSLFASMSGAVSTPALEATVGVAEDRNLRWRRTMEDTHRYIHNFGNVLGQTYLAVFDGHAGRHAADWCFEHLHQVRA